MERIDEVDPQPGELEELEETLPRAEHAESLISTAYDADAALSCEQGALDSLNTAIAELARMGSVDAKLARFADSLSEAAITIEDVAADLRRYAHDIDFDPERLAAAQERMAALKGLMRQFGPIWTTCSPEGRRRLSSYRSLTMPRLACGVHRKHGMRPRPTLLRRPVRSCAHAMRLALNFAVRSASR